MRKIKRITEWRAFNEKRCKNKLWINSFPLLSVYHKKKTFHSEKTISDYLFFVYLSIIFLLFFSKVFQGNTTTFEEMKICKSCRAKLAHNIYASRVKLYMSEMGNWSDNFGRLGLFSNQLICVISRRYDAIWPYNTYAVFVNHTVNDKID